jgi:hypothetical protein
MCPFSLQRRYILAVRNVEISNQCSAASKSHVFNSCLEADNKICQVGDKELAQHGQYEVHRIQRDTAPSIESNVFQN